MPPRSRQLLVTLASRDYLDQARQLFSSVYHNAGWRGDYLLLTHDVPESDLDWFRNKGILIYECQPLGTGLIANDSHPAIVLDKFYLFTEYFRQWQKVVFLDSDIIVFASLDRLLLTTGLAATIDVFQGKLRDQFEPLASGRRFAELENSYDLYVGCFNSGVLAFDTGVITTDLFPRLLELYKKYEILSLYGEQGIINLAFYRRWKKLSKIYNFSTYDCEIFEIKRNRVKTIVMHFMGPEKPWLPDSVFYPIWSKNLELAANINLARRLPAAKIWPGWMADNYSHFLHSRAWLRIWLRSVITRFDRSLGQIGRFIKRISPKIYNTITWLKLCFVPKTK